MIRSTLEGLLLTALLATAPASMSAQSAGSAWVITGATLIDGTGAPPLAGSRIVGRGDRILCIGREADCDVPENATIVDAAGKWAIPGLIDTHVHPGWASDAQSPREQLIRFALGITTTRDAGAHGQLETALAARARATAADAPEPRLVVSGLLSVDGDRRGAPNVGASVRKLAALGVDAIKIKEEFNAEELQAIVREAHASGLPVWGHTWTPRGSFLSAALDAGIDGVTHMFTFSEFARRADPARPAAPEGLAFWIWTKESWNYLDETRLGEALDRLLAQRVWLEPLLATERHFTLPYPVPGDVGYLAGVPSLEQILRSWLPVGDSGWRRQRARRDRLDVVYRRMCDVVRDFHKRGGIVVTGSDESPPGIALLDEVALLTGCGFTASDAISAATRYSAAVLNLRDAGTIEAGKQADIVLLDGNPLDDLANLRRTWRVIKGGRVHDPALLLAPIVQEHGREQRTTWLLRAAGFSTLLVFFFFFSFVVNRARKVPQS